MGITTGIVGLPNVGKSTLYNALTSAQVAAENYPFCTIDPNVGVVRVPDERLNRIGEIVKPEAVVPTVVEFTDIAGLVRGAAAGEGLGNQFLRHIRETDAIAHVVRCFDDADVAHVDGRIDPAGDIEIINTELALADLETVNRSIEKQERRARAGEKDAQAAMSVLARLDATLSDGKPVRSLTFASDERLVVRDLFLLTAKPVMYIANVAEHEAQAAPVAEIAAAENAPLVVLFGSIEAELAQLDEPDRSDLALEYGITESGLDRVVHAAYRLLDLITFFTGGPKEARAWTVKTGTKAPAAAGQIHTDFERGFIRAEVATYEDFVEFGGELGARNAGKLRSEGKEYVVQDGDVIHFRFNV